MSLRISLLVVVFLLSIGFEAHIEDSITLSVDDTDFSASKTEINKMLAKADLEGHGYQKEEMTMIMKDSTGREVYGKVLFYFKAVKCSKANETIQELGNLLPDTMTPALVAQLLKDLKAQNTAGRLCKIGVKTDSETTPGIVINRTKKGGLRVKRGWSARVRVDVDIGTKKSRK